MLDSARLGDCLRSAIGGAIAKGSWKLPRTERERDGQNGRSSPPCRGAWRVGGLRGGGGGAPAVALTPPRRGGGRGGRRGRLPPVDADRQAALQQARARRAASARVFGAVRERDRQLAPHRVLRRLEHVGLRRVLARNGRDGGERHVPPALRRAALAVRAATRAGRRPARVHRARARAQRPHDGARRRSHGRVRCQRAAHAARNAALAEAGRPPLVTRSCARWLPHSSGKRHSSRRALVVRT